MGGEETDYKISIHALIPASIYYTPISIIPKMNVKYNEKWVKC